MGGSVTNSRAILETADRLRTVQVRLQMDLEGVTATMLPPRSVASGEGYFEYIEGSVPISTPGSYTCRRRLPVG